ncbi:MAG: hypothetical protein R3176_02755 [Woeseiaceae bacterium]|nr:hypothetical protein [Woeseiaceae bacterium]
MADWLAEGLVFRDRDGDGIEDRFDAWPEERPVFADPRGNNSLTIRRAWTGLDGREIEDTAIEGRRLMLEVAGLPDGGATIWVVFQTPAGLRAAKADAEGPGLISVEPAADATGAHVAAGAARGVDVPLYGLRLGQPVLFAPEAAIAPGTHARIAGQHLGDVTKASLGGTMLDIVSASAEAITVALPVAPRDNRLAVSGTMGVSNVIELNLRRDVEVRVDAALGLPQGESLRLRVAGREFRVSAVEPTTVSLTAFRPVVLSFDIVGDGGVRSVSALRAIAWPGEPTTVVSAESSLLARMLTVRELLPELGGTDWAGIRAAAERIVPAAAAQDYFVALAEHAAGRAGPPGEELVIAAVAAYRELADAASAPAVADKAAGAAKAEPTPLGQPLDRIVGTTMTYLNLDTVKPDNEAPEAGYVFPESSAGSDYSQVIVLRHVDDDLFSTRFRSFSGCEFSTEEQRYETDRNASPDERDRLWRSDLCVQVDGVVYVSAAVALPGFRSAQDVFDEAAEAAAGQKPPELVRRHALPTFRDGYYQWGPGGYYLKADSGRPLCHMETCYIELITSGYGLYKNVPLTSHQKQIVETLRVRMWVEALIPWMLELADFSEEDDQNLKAQGIDVAGCLRDDLLGSLDLLAEAEKLRDFLKANQDKTGAELLAAIKQAVDLKLAPWARSYVKGELGQSFLNCLKPHVLPVSSLQDFQDEIVGKVIEKTGLTTFLTILTFVENLGSAALTPEKFVFKIQHRAEIKNVSPRTIDLQAEDGSLRIDGDWLIDTDESAATPCGGNGWCPSLVVRDALSGPGREKEIPLNESHVALPPNNCSFACRSLSIPFTELGDLEDLVNGPVRVELAIADPDYAGHFPDSKLRIPVPGQMLTLRTGAKIRGMQPPLVKAGETVRVLGSSLSNYGNAAIFELKHEGGQLQNVPMQIAESSPFPDEEVRLKVPALTSPGLYRIVMRPGPDLGDSDLEPIESQTVLGVSDTDRQAVVVGDHGIVKDDAIRVEFLDFNDNIVSYLRRPVDLLFTDMRFDLPTNELIVSVPLNTYVFGLSWDDSDDPNTSSGFAEVTEIVHKVRVTCVTPSADETCTWGIRSLKDELCVVQGAQPRPAMIGKVARGEFREYFMQPPGLDSCSFGQ